MGCFNTNGAISNLPITYGDEAVVIIGVYTEKSYMCGALSPGYTFTPLFFPVVGKYDDYGCIENIVEDANTQYIKEFFGVDDTQKILKLIDDDMCGRYIREEDEALSEIINEKIQELVEGKWKRYCYREEKFQLGYLMEHKFVYDFIAEHSASSYEYFRLDIEKSYEETLKIYKDGDFENIEFTDKGLQDMTTEELLDICERYNVSYKINKIFSRDSKMIYLGAKSDSGFLQSGIGYMYYHFLLYPYKVREDLLLCEGNKDNYINFVKFFLGLVKFNIILKSHNYGSQDANYENQLAYHEACCEFLKKQIEKDLEE